MPNTFADLLQEAERLADAQPLEFREAFSTVMDNIPDKRIVDLINIISDSKEPIYVTTTRV